MSINDYLLDEIKRLNRMNDLLEKEINKGDAKNNEPEQIVNNVNVINSVARTILGL